MKQNTFGVVCRTRAGAALVRACLIGCLGVAVPAGAHAQGATAAATDPAPTAAIVAATKAWADAFNSRDPDRIVAMYAPDAVLLGTTAKTLANGTAAIREYFKDARARPDTRVLFGEQVPAVYAGGVGTSSGAYTFTDVRDGVTTLRPARFTFVFRRDGDRWLIVTHHSSRVPE